MPTNWRPFCYLLSCGSVVCIQDRLRTAAWAPAGLKAELQRLSRLMDVATDATVPRENVKNIHTITSALLQS